MLNVSGSGRKIVGGVRGIFFIVEIHSLTRCVRCI